MRSPRVLAVALGVPPRVFEEIVLNPSRHYLPPRVIATSTPGKGRRIDRPKDPLKRIQRKIHELVVAQLIFPPDLHGGLPGGSPKRLASHHRQQPVVVRIDVADFFPSVTAEMVEDIFGTQLRCSPQVARRIARLLTLRKEDGSTFLPQGSPASTVVANLVLDRFDRRVRLAAKRCDVRYDRYVDDLVFSGEKARMVISIAIGLLASEGFRISRRKLEVMSNSGAQVAVGLRLNKRLSPSPKFRRSCAELIALVRNTEDRETIRRLRGRLRGKLAHARACEGTFSRRLDVRISVLEQELSIRGLLD